ncbi:MAG: HypC/HybG/HupF family hydrogenase formation chaperone [Deltaproteobacteria bacterium]|nr:HypC/HybG/HupF family hydrogenase formation chaperone [Deltaproteobacteria bacterium]
MCLAIPMKIIEKNGDSGIVETFGVKKEISLYLVDADIGEYVLVHAGVAIGKVSKKDALETEAIIKETL